MTDTTDPTWGDGPPRAAIELDPAQVAVLYPCLEPVPHAPHRREGIDGATLWAYRCDGQGGMVQPTHDEAVVVGDHDPVAGDWRYAAHQAAETQLEELERAQDCPEECAEHDPDVTELRCEGPARQAGPYCGCRTCLIREVLFAATPIIVAAAVAEAYPTRAHTSPPVGT